MEKSTYGMDWLQKSIWYGLIKLINRLSQNIQDIRQSHKVYKKYYGKLKSQTDRKWKQINWGQNLERDLPERYTITITISNSDDDTTQLHT